MMLVNFNDMLLNVRKCN